MNDNQAYILCAEDIEVICGGFACGGMCVVGIVATGAALFSAGIDIGRAM